MVYIRQSKSSTAHFENAGNKNTIKLKLKLVPLPGPREDLQYVSYNKKERRPRNYSAYKSI